MLNNLTNNMVRSPYVVDTETSVRSALEMMRELEIRHLPVMRESKLVGLVSERDLASAVQLPLSDKLRIEDVMIREVFAVTKDTPLKTVVREMAARKLGSAVVLNQRREVVGIFTTTDAMNVLADLLDDQDADEFLLKDDLFESWEDLNDSICPAASAWAR